MRVVVDTNVLISAAFKNGKPKIAIASVISSQKFVWIVSQEIIDEYKDVLNRRKFRLSDDQKQEWLEIIDLSTVLINVNVNINFPRDRKDAKFLSCALTSQADYLITGDRDFEELPDLMITKIVTVSQFLELMEVK